MRRWVSAVLLVAALLAPAAARADGDPASDYLLTQPLFTPLDVQLPKASVAQLTAIQKDAKAKGYEVRVALVASRFDLGAVSSLFNQPQKYAEFLAQEIRFVYKGPLLVVMPNGYGYHAPGKATFVDSSRRPSQFPDLAQAAVPIVQLLARKNGVDVPIPTLGGDSGGSNTTRDRILIAVGAVVVAALFGAALWLRSRPRGRRGIVRADD